MLAAFEVDQAEHFAAQSLVAYPEDKIVAPLHRFMHMRQREQESAGAFGIHVLYVTAKF